MHTLVAVSRRVGLVHASWEGKRTWQQEGPRPAPRDAYVDFGPSDARRHGAARQGTSGIARLLALTCAQVAARSEGLAPALALYRWWAGGLTPGE